MSQKTVSSPVHRAIGLQEFLALKRGFQRGNGLNGHFLQLSGYTPFRPIFSFFDQHFLTQKSGLRAENEDFRPIQGCPAR